MNEMPGSGGDVRVVQLPHPGGEHDMSRRTTRPWQSGEALHRRTFLQAPGSYRTTPTGNDVQGDIAVWTEWEAEARVLTDLDPVPGGPRWLCQANPEAEPPELPDGVPPQNTDPFVFGDRFRYSGCKQPDNIKLRTLGRGALILFGSNTGGQFALDTVFVVAGWVDHTRDTYKNLPDGITSDAHRLFMLDPWYGWNTGKTFRLYLGATTDMNIDGMFSYVPCRPANGRQSGFARPTIDIQPYINPNLRMAARSSAPLQPSEVASVWNAVTRRVTTDGLALATRIIV